jgi:hypothetical protein
MSEKAYPSKISLLFASWLNNIADRDFLIFFPQVLQKEKENKGTKQSPRENFISANAHK